MKQDSLRKNSGERRPLPMTSLSYHIPKENARDFLGSGIFCGGRGGLPGRGTRKKFFEMMQERG